MWGPYPNEDSTDLSDHEREGATPSRDLAEFTALLQEFLRVGVCPTCQATSLALSSHALRRRKPDLFWRTTLTCQAGHDIVRTFSTPWLQGGTHEL